MSEGFDPRKSKVSDDTMKVWRDSQLRANLQDVPGIGPAAEEKLKAAGIINTYQLIGKYLSFRDDTPDEPMSSVSHNDIFWFWLKDHGITAHRSAIVKAIAEKLAAFIPDMYDPNAYDSDDDE